MALNVSKSLLPINIAQQLVMYNSYQITNHLWCLQDQMLLTLHLVLAMGPGNLPALRVWTRKTVPFGSRPVQNPDPELLAVPNPYPCQSTRGFCQVWLDPSVPVSGSPFRVFLFMVAVRYVTVMCNILTLVHDSLYLFHWRSLYSKQGETCFLLHPEVECEQFFIFHHL
jgi:hypothetical protein